ncbi:hypothetical protein [Peptoniphilus harei]
MFRTAKFIKGSEIKDGDSVIIFNFRPDRVRQITRALVDDDFAGFERKKIDTTLVAMTEYDKEIKNKLVPLRTKFQRILLEKFLKKIKSSNLGLPRQKNMPTLHFSLMVGVKNPLKERTGSWSVSKGSNL